ncbi:MAG: hypothetical protein J6U83_05550 [Bacteroidales bacterium]|nr:hypothetical protein [Bacteroidales bacterium]
MEQCSWYGESMWESMRSSGRVCGEWLSGCKWHPTYIGNSLLQAVTI